VHKEVKYGELDLGSPGTHAWKWEFYTPRLEILELFPYTEEGWKEACKVEKRCIKPDLNNPLCLNESMGGLMSLETARRGGNKRAENMHKEKDEFGRSVHAVKALGKVHDERDEFGRSVRGVRSAERLNAMLHERKDELGRSVHGVKLAERTNSQIWQSAMDGFKSTPSAVARHNKAKGWDPAARVRIS
jgi:hypothetical protein